MLLGSQNDATWIFRKCLSLAFFIILIFLKSKNNYFRNFSVQIRNNDFRDNHIFIMIVIFI